MTSLSALWLPILLSAVGVFILSSIIHMFLGWHNRDYPKLPEEDRARDAIRALAIPPGDYFVPRPAGRQDMRSPEFEEKMIKGPVMIMTVLPNGPSKMGKSLTLWFLYAIIVGAFAGYIAGCALAPGADSARVFHFVVLTSFLGYAAALWQMSIWYHRSWGTTLRTTLDGVLYALLTAGIFVWLWPR